MQQKKQQKVVNSYAWDTTTLFLQKCGTNSKYSRQNSLNITLANKGTNNLDTKDVQCNIYDMASNVYELTTESSSYSWYPCTNRGGSYADSQNYMSYYHSNNTYDSYVEFGFRPLLYLQI